jgi:hypothetical protein
MRRRCSRIDGKNEPLTQRRDGQLDVVGPAPSTDAGGSEHVRQLGHGRLSRGHRRGISFVCPATRDFAR